MSKLFFPIFSFLLFSFCMHAGDAKKYSFDDLSDFLAIKKELIDDGTYKILISEYKKQIDNKLSQNQSYNVLKASIGLFKVLSGLFLLLACLDNLVFGHHGPIFSISDELGQLFVAVLFGLKAPDLLDKGSNDLYQGLFYKKFLEEEQKRIGDLKEELSNAI